MKFNRIEKRENGSYEIMDVIEKVNEIIDFLNNSYITLEKNEALACLDNCISSISTISDGISIEKASLSDELVLSSGHSVTITHNSIKCPNCGDSYYKVGESISTCVYYQPVYKNGVNINPDHNRSTTQYECCSCGHIWSQSN